MHSQGLSSTLAGLPQTTAEPGQSVKGENQHPGPARPECASVSSEREEISRIKAELCGSGFQKLEEQQNTTAYLPYTVTGRAIEKPLRAPWGYLFPQTHGNCVLGTICHLPKLLLFSVCVYLVSARDASWKPTWNLFFFPIRYLWYNGHHHGLVQLWMYLTLIQPSHLLFRPG